MKTKKLAKMAVALEMCKILHEKGDGNGLFNYLFTTWLFFGAISCMVHELGGKHGSV